MDTPTQPDNTPVLNASPHQGKEEPKTEPKNDKSDKPKTDKSELDINSLLEEIKAEEEAKKKAVEEEKQKDKSKLKDTVKDLLRKQIEEKEQYEAKLKELSSSMEELKAKMENTSVGSKVPQNKVTEVQNEQKLSKMEVAIKYYADKLRNWAKD